MSVVRQEPSWLRWAVSGSAVLVAHLLAAAVLWWWPAWHAPEPVPLHAQAVMVELAAATRAPSALPTELPPGSLQQEQAARTAVPGRDPTPPRPPEPRQVVAENNVALSRQVPAVTQARGQPQQDSDSAPASDASAPPSVQAPQSHQYQASEAVAGTTSRALADWQGQVLGHLERFKRFPRVAQRRRYEGVVQMRYAVDRQGNVLDASVARSSGHDALDAEALAAVRRASPLPPPPTDIPGDPVKVTTPVEFFLR